ncbi:phosphoribosylformylglycinamidine synthase subunit PurQ, partial [Facklamia hominis]|uniref:phosphoribosylformylglycinamidine synthase subunit PurQ n=1 Tax=Facklamia hominis TaxID=178214 RepID=UPI0010274A0D
MALGNQIGVSLDPAYLGQKYPLAFIIETDSSTTIPEGHSIGSTQSDQYFVADQRYSLAELERIYTQLLADVFTEIDLIDQPLELDQVAPFSSLEPIQSSLKVLIPVMTGTNGEYDLYQSFKEYTDQVDFYVIKESIDYAQSIKELKDKLADYDILALPDGMIQGNQTEFGKGVELLLQDLGEALERFIKDHYVLGIGASFAGLIRSGLIEFSRLQAGTQIRIQKNPYDKTINEIVSVTVIRPSIYAGVGQYHTALASKWLAIDCDDSLESQVISRFNRFLAGHSAIDAMMDSTGHVFGSIGNFERFSHKGLVNQTVHQAPFIQGLVQAIEGERK